MPHHRPKYKDYWWDDLPEEARKAAGVLGWDTKEKWDNSVDVPFRTKKFEEMTLLEKQAAIFLQIDLFGKYLDIWWSEADPETKKAALALDWTQDKWDHDWALWDLEVDHKYWKEMTDTEKAGAMHFGYTHHTWDEDMVEVFEVDASEKPTALPELPPEEMEKDEDEEEETEVVEESEPAAESADAGATADAASSASAAASTNKKKKFKVSSQYGGRGGDVFDHRNHRRIQKLTVYSGKRHVDAIEVQYENGITIKSGGDGGSPESLEVESGEWIVAADVRHNDDGIQCLTFKTNKGRSLGPCGSTGGLLVKAGVENKLKAPPTMKLVGFKGRKGNRLDAIALRWGPAKE